MRSRKRDIPVLVEHFIARYAEENAKTIEGVSKEAMDLLMRYVYPGNVRELQNIIERAVVMARGDVVTKNDLSLEGQEMQSAAESLPSGATLSEQVEDLEKKAIAEALQQANGIQSRAAEILGLTERNLRYKLKKYGLK